MISYEKYAQLRDSAGLTDYSVSKELGFKMIIYDWKAGKGTPKTENLLKIAGLFNVPIETFIVEDEPKEKCTT